ncbi:MAG: molybdopterin converting factor subunit 1 [Trueperaceae bacterium]|nr:molybdopterin converting factor subunit 1 [Trueperaceae bacterium]
MTVQVLFFASLREAANTRELQLSLDAPLNVRNLATRIERDYKGLELSGSLCAINEHYVDPDTLINEGDTIAFFPPVSGG